MSGPAPTRSARHVAAGAHPGGHLRRLRTARGISQMALALAAGVSQRHLGFVELERAFPGRDVLLNLATALSLSEDELQALLGAAGYAPPPLTGYAPCARQLEPVLEPVRALLEGLEPCPAVLLDAGWDMLMVNRAYARLAESIHGRDLFPAGALEVTDPVRPNRLRELWSTTARAAIENWEHVVCALMARARDEAGLSRDPALAALLDEAARLPVLGTSEPARHHAYPLRVEIALRRHRFRLYSLTSAWASRVPGLRIELLHPVDERSERSLERFAREPGRERRGDRIDRARSRHGAAELRHGMRGR